MDFDSKLYVKKFFGDVKQYVEKRIELKALEFQQKGSVLAAAIVSNSLGVAFILIGMLFLLFALGIGLGYLFDNMMLGFIALALILIILGVYLYKTKKNVLQNRLQLQINLFIDSVLDAPDLNEEMMGEEMKTKNKTKTQTETETTSAQNESVNRIHDSEKN